MSVIITYFGSDSKQMFSSLELVRSTCVLIGISSSGSELSSLAFAEEVSWAWGAANSRARYSPPQLVFTRVVHAKLTLVERSCSSCFTQCIQLSSLPGNIRNHASPRLALQSRSANGSCPGGRLNAAFLHLSAVFLCVTMHEYQ